MTADPVVDPVAPVVRSAWIPRPAAETFEVFTAEIGAWWPLLSHGLFGERAGGLAFRDGRLIEHSVDGDEAVWGEVRAWEPPHRVVITWHPGRDADEGSEVEVRFQTVDDGTRVVLEHRGWERFGTEGLARRRSYVGPGAWGFVLDHFADGAEPRTDGADLTPLRAAYDEFLTEADRRDFVEPPDGEWGGAQVIAHVALNDAAMLAVSHALLDGRSVTFENQTCQDAEVLDRWVRSASTHDELVARCRRSADQVLAALARLSPDQRATAVHCRLSHDGETVLDDTRPWAAIAIDTQAGMHLPGHTRQLRALRPPA